MNQQQQQAPYMDSQHSMSASQQYAGNQGPAHGLAQYPAYAQHHQPQHALPAVNQYAQSPASYGHGGAQYGYGQIPSPHGSTQPVSLPSHLTTPGLPSLTTMAAGAPQHSYVGNASASQQQSYQPSQQPPPPQQQPQQDPTGQIAPAGMKPRVTATLWEDEGCMCFQVETKGVCVARRDDNHMINGTKLLNVAGMTRGRRDGILKSEKTRNVVKIGPMHLKGVWIPFDRALDFANKEKITDSLYPLFVHNIGALLYHPSNTNRHGAVVNAHEQRRRLGDQKPQSSQSQQGAVPSASQPPSLTHHHSITSSSGTQQQQQSAASVASSASSGRPALDRAHTFPTPPTSASGMISGIGSQQGSYDWPSNNIANTLPTGAGLGVDSSHAHSTPATPASTPPGSALPSLQYPTHQPLYSAQSAQGYPSHQQGMARTSSLGSDHYIKQEMGPPAGMTAKHPADVKLDSYGQPQGLDHSHPATAGADDPAHAHAHYHQDHAYSHRNSYDAYTSSLPSDNGAERDQWATAGTGYQTPPRAPPSGNLYNATSDARGSIPNGSGDGYVPNAYAPTQMNGLNPSGKRMRDEDEEIEGMKRQKMGDHRHSNGLMGVGVGFGGGGQARASAAAKTARAR